MGGQSTPLIKVRGVDYVSGLPEFLRKCEETRRLSLRMMKEQYFGHPLSLRLPVSSMAPDHPLKLSRPV